MSKFNYGENLRNIRRAKNISQEAIASHLNISQRTYARRERQTVMRDKELTIKIANYFEIDPAELMPPLEKLDSQTTQATLGLGQKTKNLMNTKAFIWLFIIALGCAILPAVYALTQAFCIQFKASDPIIDWMPRATSLAMFAYLWYMGKKLLRSVQPSKSQL